MYPLTPSNGCVAFEPIFRFTGNDAERLPESQFSRCSVRIYEAIRRAVLFLGIANDKGDFSPYGTGFLIGKKVEGGGFPYLVTARHVLNDMRKSKRPMVARLNLKHGGAQLGGISGDWQTHPTDTKCDVAVTQFTASSDLFDFAYLQEASVLTPSYIQENDIGAGDPVFTVGLLVSHFGRNRNVTIVRSGNIAAMPEEHVDLGDKFGEQEVYLVESRSIGGLSGSPVFLQTSLHRVVNGRIVSSGGHLSEYLMGVHIGLFETKAGGDTIKTEMAERRENFLEAMSAGIGIVVPIQRVMEIIDGPILTQRREEAMKRSAEKNSFVPTSGKPSAETSSSDTSALPSTDDNPKHREDFTRLLSVAARKPRSGD